MNKFAVYAILAFAVVGANAHHGEPDEGISELSLRTSDTDEVAGLTGNMKAFDSFCLQSRDFVVTSLETTSNMAAKSVFNLFLKSAEDIAESTLDVSRNGVDRLGNQLRNPNAEIAPAQGEADEILANGQQKIKDASSQASALISAFRTQLIAAGTEAYRQFSARIHALKEKFNLAKLNEAINAVCQEVVEYENKILGDFEAAKNEFSSKDASFKDISLAQVNCVTVKRVVRLEGMCKLMETAQQPLKKLLQTVPMRSRE